MTSGKHAAHSSLTLPYPTLPYPTLPPSCLLPPHPFPCLVKDRLKIRYNLLIHWIQSPSQPAHYLKRSEYLSSFLGLFLANFKQFAAVYGDECLFFFNRYLIRICVESHGLNSIRNPNVLEVSLNKSFWESQNRDHSGSRYSSSTVPSPAPPQDIGVGAADASSDIPLTHLPQYTRSGCLSAPCVKVVTVNRVQSTYVVPTFITQGGDVQTLNALCKYITNQTPCSCSSLQLKNNITL